MSRQIVVNQPHLPYGMSALSIEGESQVSAHIDHQHELFEEWEPIPLVGHGAAYGAPYRTPSVCKAGGLILLDGGARIGDSELFGVLPKKYRPPRALKIITCDLDGGNLADLNIFANGDLLSSTGIVTISLCSVMFRNA